MPIVSRDVLLSRQEVAQRLQVSVRRVTDLCDSEELTAIRSSERNILITETSVLRYERGKGKSGRPYSPSMAFAALYLLSGLDVAWLSRQERYRLKHYLHDINAASLTRLSRRRAKKIEYWCRDSMLADVSRRIRPSAATGELADQFHLTHTDLLEGYISCSALDEIVAQCRLRQGASPVMIRLHVASHLPEGYGAMPVGVCAADLAESDDPRERRAGLETLDRLLESFNRKES